MLRLALFTFVLQSPSIVVAYSYSHASSTYGLRKRPSSSTRCFQSSGSLQVMSDTARLKRTGTLMDWASKNGIKIAGVNVQASKAGGLGLIASQDLSSNDLAITVPSSLALSLEAPGDGPDDQTVLNYFDKRLLRDAPWYAQFSAYLCTVDKLTKSKGNGAIDMTAWLDSLPRSFDTPIHWNTDTLAELQYKHLVNSVKRQEQHWKALYNSILRAASPLIVDSTSFEDFVWGCECSRSRAFSGAYTGSAFNPWPFAFTLLLVTGYVGLNLGTLEQAANGAALVLCASVLKDFVVPKLSKKKRYVICPVVDMANHQSLGITGDVSFEFFGDAYSLAISSNVLKGSEVYISYGARSNDQLLQYYGFVEADNPHDVYIMPPLREWDITALEKATKQQFEKGRLNKLDRAGLLGQTRVPSYDTDSTDDQLANPMGGVVITRAGGVDPAVMQALRALVASETEWEKAGRTVGSFAEELSGGPENERLARLAAKTGLELELSSKATSAEQDLELIKTMKLSKRTAAESLLAIKFRVEKKKLLQETIDSLT